MISQLACIAMRGKHDRLIGMSLIVQRRRRQQREWTARLKGDVHAVA